jgi:hypothetical protein
MYQKYVKCIKKYIDNELEIRKNELIIIIHILRHIQHIPGVHIIIQVHVCVLVLVLVLLHILVHILVYIHTCTDSDTMKNYENSDIWQGEMELGK